MRTKNTCFSLYNQNKQKNEQRNTKINTIITLNREIRGKATIKKNM